MSLDCTGLTVTLGKALLYLSNEGVDKVGTDAINAGAGKAVLGIKKAIPKTKKGKDSDKRMKDAVGKKKVTKTSRKKGYVQAKVGIGVGKKKGSYSPHAIFQAVGTGERVRKNVGGKYKGRNVKSKNTGKITKHNAVARGVAEARSKILKAVADKASKTLVKECAKARKKAGKKR